MDNHELTHHGIKGMKWGVRRYQNKNGTLTPAGKKRYKKDIADEARGLSDQELRSRINRMNLEKRYETLSRTTSYGANKAFDIGNKTARIGSNVGQTIKKREELRGKKQSPRGELVSQGSNIVSSSVSLARNVTQKISDKKAADSARTKAATMTDEDLQDIVNRMDLEQKYTSLKRETISRGRVTVTNVLDVAGDVLAIGASAAAIAVSVKKLRS